MVGTNIGIDFGTANIKVYMEGKGIVVTEPSVVAYDQNNKLIAIGQKAYNMLDKTPDNVRVVQPVVNGVISDFVAARQIIEYYISRVCKNMVFRPNVVVNVHSSVTGLQKKTIIDTVTAAGAAKACLIEEPLAAAIGMGLDISKPRGVMIVDIGAGTTDIAVITMGSIAVSKSITDAGNALNDGIIRQLRRERDLIIGEKTAERIKLEIGAATLRDVELGLAVNGKNYITNMPVNFEVSSTEIFLAMRSTLEGILEGIRSVLEQISPEFSADILDNGIILTGGGAKLRYIDKMIKRKLGLKVKVASSPEFSVAEGTGRALEHLDILYSDGNMFNVGTIGKEKD
ncbi:MAG: rod shape-determining protein [Clostridia bacterium]|nr:rod shape-determining protein [Clostridia bacterium]